MEKKLGIVMARPRKEQMLIKGVTGPWLCIIQLTLDHATIV
jgi:hypothetical protein